MYLLIQAIVKSILIKISHLHPTMYLLIPARILSSSEIIIYLHPTMYLLIRWSVRHGDG